MNAFPAALAVPWFLFVPPVSFVWFYSSAKQDATSRGKSPTSIWFHRQGKHWNPHHCQQKTENLRWIPKKPKEICGTLSALLATSFDDLPQCLFPMLHALFPWPLCISNSPFGTNMLQVRHLILPPARYQWWPLWESRSLGLVPPMAPNRYLPYPPSHTSALLSDLIKHSSAFSTQESLLVLNISYFPFWRVYA